MKLATLFMLSLGLYSCRTTSSATSNLAEARMSQFLFKTSADKKYIQRYTCFDNNSDEAKTCEYETDYGYFTHVDYLKKELRPLIVMKNKEAADKRDAELRPYAEKVMQARAKVTPFYDEKKKNQAQIDAFKKDNTAAALKQIQALEARNAQIDQDVRPLERNYDSAKESYDRKAAELAKATEINFEKFFTEIYAVVGSGVTYRASLDSELRTNLGILNEAIEQIWSKKIVRNYGWVDGSEPPEDLAFEPVYAYPTGVSVYISSRRNGRGPKIAGFTLRSIDENGGGKYSYSDTSESGYWGLKPDPNDKSAFLITRSGSNNMTYKISLTRPRNN